MNINERPQPLTISDYADVLQRRVGTVVLTAALVLGAMAAYAFLSAPVYRATALLDIEKVSDVVTPSQSWSPPDDDYLATQARLIVSETALTRAFQALDLGRRSEFKKGLPALRDAVSVAPVPKTRLAQIHAESRDPKLAAAIANRLAEDFVKENLDNQLFMPKDVLNALRTRAKGPEAEKIYESLPAVISNPVLQQIKAEILKREVALAELRGRYTDDHPEVRAMQAQLALVQAARSKELANVVRSVTTSLSGQLRPNNVRVIDAALPPSRPARPRRGLALALGLLGGLGLGVLAALARESLDKTVRTHSDIEVKAGLPFLGQIPLAPMPKGQSVYAPVAAAPWSQPAEAFRDLRTMVDLARTPKDDPFLLVTSTREQEGKSFVAANLAVSLSQLGGKVLVVDGDLRRPTHHRYLGDPDQPGLSEFLAGRVGDPSRLPQRTEIPNLDVLPAGRAPESASELLNARQLEELVRWARGRYDRVIVDCPPVFPVADVLLWGRHVRASILVSRCGRTPLPMIQLACDRLRAGNIDVLGGVLNGARLRSLNDPYARNIDKSGFSLS